MTTRTWLILDNAQMLMDLHMYNDAMSALEYLGYVAWLEGDFLMHAQAMWHYALCNMAFGRYQHAEPMLFQAQLEAAGDPEMASQFRQDFADNRLSQMKQAQADHIGQHLAFVATTSGPDDAESICGDMLAQEQAEHGDHWMVAQLLCCKAQIKLQQQQPLQAKECLEQAAPIAWELIHRCYWLNLQIADMMHFCDEQLNSSN